MIKNRRELIQRTKKILCILGMITAICMSDNIPKVTASEVTEETTIIASGNCGKVDENNDGSNLTWELDSDGTLTIFGSGEMADYGMGTSPWCGQNIDITELVLPEGLINIGDYAFFACSVSGEIKLPSTIEKVGNNAFYNNKIIGKIQLPESVYSIGWRAFYNCTEITELQLSESLEQIGDEAFYNCDKIASISISENNEAYCCADGVLYNKEKTKIVIFPGAKKGKFEIPDTVTSISNDIFISGVGLTEFSVSEQHLYYSTIDGVLFNKDQTSLIKVPNAMTGKCQMPDTVMAVDSNAFNGCIYIEEIYISNNVSNVNKSWFSTCESLRTFNVSDSNTYYSSANGFLLTKDKSEILIVPNIIEGDCVIPEGVTTIQSGLFNGVNGNGGLEIASTVKTIEQKAFFNSSFNGSLTINKGVESIGFGAFFGCDGLSGGISIPDSVTTIGASAFAECDGFTGDLIIPDSVTTIGASAFEKCTGLNGKLTISKSVTEIGEGAFSGCCNLIGELTIPQRLTKIESSIFCDCNKLTGDIKIPDGVTSIGEYAFAYCSSLDGELTLPDSIISVGDSSFYDCSKLQGQLNMLDNLTSIGSYAFSGCGSLTGELKLSEELTEINEGIFNECKGLTGGLVIPPNVTQIGDSAFNACSGLTGELVISNDVTSIGERAFNKCSGLTGKLTIPNGVSNIGESAFSYCSGLTGGLVIPEGMTNIEPTTFSYCSGLTEELIIPSGIINIGESAFYKCSGLERVTISTVEQIDRNAFAWSGIDEYIVSEENQYYCSLDGVLYSKDKSKLIAFPAGREGKYTIDGNVELQEYAFYGSQLNEIVISDGIEEIPECTFLVCENLKRIDIADSVKVIDRYAFNRCINLETVKLPKGLESIGVLVFGSCTKLKGFEISELNETFCVSDGVVYSKDKTKLIAFPVGREGSFTIPKGTKVIGEYAFSSALINDITISETVTDIEGYAFQLCEQLETICIEEGVTGIRSNFSGCTNIKKIVIPQSVSSISLSEITKNIVLYVLKDSYGEQYAMERGYAYEYYERVVVTIKNDSNKVVQEIIVIKDETLTEPEPSETKEGYKFLGFYNGDTRFDFTQPITGDITLTEKWELAEQEDSCTTGHSWDEGKVVKEASTTAEGEKLYTCKNCGETKTDKIPKLPSNDNNNTNPPEDSTGKDNDTIPENEITVGDILKNPDDGTEYKVLITNGDNKTVEYIGEKNSKKKTIKIPATITIDKVIYKVTSVADNAFKNNKTVTKITIGNNVKTIGENAFNGCKNLKSVTIGKNVTSIGSKAFYNCKSLTQITIPSKVTKIDSYAFKNCKKLSSVTIGKSVKTIGKEAFRGCSKLKSINIKSTKLKTVGKNAFKGIKSSAKIKVPSSKLKSYKNLLKNKGQSKKVKIAK